MITSEKKIDLVAGEFTCTCFINKVNEAVNITLARESCKEEVRKNLNFNIDY